VASTEVLVEGVQETYARAQRLGLKAYFKDTSRAYHRWRKWVKYLYYQLEILSPQGEEFSALHDALGDLGKILGASHDMANLREVLVAGSVTLDDVRAVRRVVKLARRRERELLESSRPFAAAIFDEHPQTLAHRLILACS
jgi:CHAD domain-containing protein